MRYLTIFAPLALVACSGGGDAGSNDGAANDTVASGGGMTEPVPDNLSDDPGNAVVPLGNDAVPAPTPVADIPADFRGRWGLVPNDCDPTRADAKGLMTVEADMLRFYESRAKATNLAATATVMTGDLAFSGEGQTWQQQVRLVLQDDGRTLVRDVTGGETTGEGTLRYSRCPALKGTS
jgi:hypothetical protein